MNYILFDHPESWKSFLPLTFTRPVSELRAGILTIRQKWEKLLHTSCSWLTESYLREKYPVKISDKNLLLNSTVLPDAELLAAINRLPSGTSLVSEGILIACSLDENGLQAFARGDYDTENEQNYSEKLTRIVYPWDLFEMNGDLIGNDFELITSGRTPQPLNDTNTLLKPDMIFAEEGVSMDAVTLNATNGPIYLGRDSEIMEGTVIRGPFALCHESVVKMNAKIYGPTTIGPMSMVGGEIKNSVFLGLSNKAHDGYLGNAVIGEWCNIGADTNNSNLKNNYAQVKLWSYTKEAFIDTGLQFCGMIMGDHSKCSINTMFNTGTVVGVFANIFGSGFPRNFIPSFSWGGPSGMSEYKLEKAFEVAEIVMMRREIELDAVEQKILKTIFEMTAKYRP